MTLSDTEYRVLDLFVQGGEAPAIADALGMRTMDVSSILNLRVKRSRTTARDLINQQAPPASSGPLVAPVLAPKAKPVPKLPARLVDEPVPEAPNFGNDCVMPNCDWRCTGFTSEAAAQTALENHLASDPHPQPAAPLVPPPAEPTRAAPKAKETDIPAAPFLVNLDDLDTAAGVMTVAVDHEAASIRDKAATVSEQLAALRQEIIRWRRNEATSAARARIAELEAELSQLRQLVGAA